MSSLQLLFTVLKGGPTSGNFGHGGRPGRIGGSSPNPLDSGTLTRSEDQNYEPGVFESYLGEVEGAGKVIVKPSPISQAMAEYTAYYISKKMGYEDMVPETTVREVGGGFASVQKWSDAEGAYNWDLNHSGDELDVESFKQMAIFDIVIGNIDRKAGNFLIDKQGKVVAIDHNLSLNQHTKPASAAIQFERTSKIFNRLTGQDLTISKSDIAPALKVIRSEFVKERIENSFGEKEWRNMVSRTSYLKSIAK